MGFPVNLHYVSAADGVYVTFQRFVKSHVVFRVLRTTPRSIAVCSPVFKQYERITLAARSLCPTKNLTQVYSHTLRISPIGSDSILQDTCDRG